ncbi:MAG: hypothetical protein P8172_15280 [Gammaproteobacteria bacterium]|jgi:hypothetical protein
MEGTIENADFSGGGLLMLIIYVALIVIPFWRICQKAGYPGALGLLMIVPIANLILLYYLAFATWPIHKGAPPAAGGMG